MKITAKAIIEVAGFPKEHVEKSIQDIASQLDKNEEFKVISKEIEEVKEVNKMWATFIDTELEFENLKDLLKFNLYFLPSSVEIVEPEKLNIDTNEMSDFMNTMQAKLHEYTGAINKLIIENKFLKKKAESSSQ